MWEKSKREKRKSRLIRLIILSVVAIVLISLANKLPVIYREFNNPFPRFAEENKKTQSLNTSFRTNYLLLSYEANRLVDAAVASLEPLDKKVSLLLFDLPNNKNIRLSTNKVFREGGIEGLDQHVSVSLGIILDRYVAFENDAVRFTSPNIQDTHEQFKSTSVFLRAFSIRRNLDDNLKTNFSTAELFSLFWKIRSSELDEKNIILVTDINVKDLADEKLSELVNNFFFDRDILEEAATVSIRNSSGVVGVGSALASILANLGAVVVEVDTGEDISEESLLIIRNKKPKIEERISNLLKFDKKGGNEDDFAGDILINLGKNATDELTLP